MTHRAVALLEHHLSQGTEALVHQEQEVGWQNSSAALGWNWVINNSGAALPFCAAKWLFHVFRMRLKVQILIKCCFQHVLVKSVCL